MTLLALDVGSSSIKGALVDADAMQIQHARRVPFPLPLTGRSPLYREYDPEHILIAVQGLLRDLVALAGTNPIEGLVMCSQMHGLVCTSSRGEPRSTLTTWQDQRVLMPYPSGSGTYFDELMQRISNEDKRKLGNEMRVGLPIGVLFWLSERGELPKGDVIPVSLPDYLLTKLCGTSPTTEVINAQSHGALDLTTMAWNPSLLASLGLQHLHFPSILRHGEVVGLATIDGQSFPCYTPIGDYQCALLGALVKEGELSLNISTGSQVSLLRHDLQFGTFQTRPFFDNRFAITVTTIPAGRSLQALVKLLTEFAAAQGINLANTWEYIEQSVSAMQGHEVEMQVNLSFFNSAVGRIGSITNIREEEMTVGHLFHAAFENMAHNYYTCAERLSPMHNWERLVFSGGVAQKLPSLRQTIAAEFYVPARLAPHEEDTLFGLLALGMAFTGRTVSVEEAAAKLSILSPSAPDQVK